MTDQNTVFDKTDLLNDVSMKYEVSVIPFFEQDYLKEFCDFYRIRNRDLRLIPSDDGFDEALKNLSGEYRWESIAEKAKELFGPPVKITVFEDSKDLVEELGGPKGLSGFFFVFDLMFCEYEDYTLCFICGSNN